MTSLFYRQSLRFATGGRRLASMLNLQSQSRTLSNGYHLSSTFSGRFRNRYSFAWTTKHTAFFSTDGAATIDDGHEESGKKGVEKMEFKAETKQLLDIVTNSLYTDKEVFLRELVSNASDALEKLRHIQSTGSEPVIDPDTPLEIRIDTSDDNTIVISDTGIGMTKEEMTENLGTIARSGSRAFLNELQRQSEEGDTPAERGIIGRFGVGFYSSFMIGERVQVRSRSALERNADEPVRVWESSGVGSYEIFDYEAPEEEEAITEGEAEGEGEGEETAATAPLRGASITIHLKESCKEFADEKRIESILKKYSNFVNFPIILNGVKVNTIDAVWSKDPKQVDDETYTGFYKYISNAFDEPLDRIHFRADAPIDIKCLLFIPSFHSEKYGMARMEPGVSLYSRKIMIESKAKGLLPEWMRFLKGVVDSEDLPLSISREKAQGSGLISKLNKVLTKKFISHLGQMNKKNNDKYKKEFYPEFGFFLKEGACQDFDNQEALANLLYFETNKGTKGDTFSFAEYVSRLSPDQKEIYYLTAPSRELALQSPYMEAVDDAGREVFFLYNAVDDFVFSNLQQYEDRKIVSIDSGSLEDLKKTEEDKENEKSESDKKDSESAKATLSEQEADEFCAWVKVTMGEGKVSSCKTTNRLTNTPAVIVDNESGSMRRMMRFVESQASRPEESDLGAQVLHINPNHPTIVGLNSIRDREPTLATVVLEQIYDNCLVAVGLLDDGRSMLPRLNDLLLTVIKDAEAGVRSSSSDSSEGPTGTDEAEEEEEAEVIEKK